MGLPAAAPPPPLKGPGSQPVPNPKAQRARRLLQQLLQTQPQQATPPGIGQDAGAGWQNRGNKITSDMTNVGTGEDLPRANASPALQGLLRPVGVGADDDLTDLQTRALQSAVQRHVGTPYVLGGNDLTHGIDCSGFVNQILRGFGANVPGRPSTVTYRNQLSVPISWEEIRPGDILLSAANPRDPVSGEHMALYVGGGQMAESRGGEGVRIGPVQGTRLLPHRMLSPVPGLQDATRLAQAAGADGATTVTPASANNPLRGGDARLLSAEGQAAGQQISQWDDLIRRHAPADLGQDPNFVYAVNVGIHGESGGDPRRHERGGPAVGLFQIQDPVRFDRTDPEESARYMLPRYADAYRRVQREHPDWSREDQAILTAAYAERPRGYTTDRQGNPQFDMQSPAAANYRRATTTLPGGGGGHPLAPVGDLAAQGLGWLQDRIAQAGGLLEPPPAYAAEDERGAPTGTHTGRTWEYTGPPARPPASPPGSPEDINRRVDTMLAPGVQAAGDAYSGVGTVARGVADAVGTVLAPFGQSARNIGTPTRAQAAQRTATAPPPPPLGVPTATTTGRAQTNIPADYTPPPGPQWGTTPEPADGPPASASPAPPPAPAGPPPEGAYVGPDGEHYSSATGRPYWGPPHQTVQSNGLIVAYYGDAEDLSGGRGRLHETESVTDPQGLEARQWAAIWKRQQDEYDRATPTAAQTSEQAIARDRFNAELVNRQALLEQHAADRAARTATSEADRASREATAAENRAERHWETEQRLADRQASAANTRQQLVGSAQAGYQTTLGDLQRLGATGMAFTQDGSAAHILGPDGRPIQTINLGVPRPTDAPGTVGFQQRYNPTTQSLEQGPIPGAPAIQTAHQGAILNRDPQTAALSVASMLPLQVSTSTDDFGRVIQVRPDGEVRVLSDGQPKQVVHNGQTYLQYPPRIPRYIPPQTQQQPYGYAQTPATGTAAPHPMQVLAQLGVVPDQTYQVPRSLVDQARALGWRPMAEQTAGPLPTEYGARPPFAGQPAAQFEDYAEPARSAPPFSGSGPGYLPPPRPPEVSSEVTDETDVSE